MEYKPLKILREQIGHKLVSYECGEGELMFHRAYGNIRLNFEEGAFEIDNIQKPMTVLGEADDISIFSCQQVDPNSKYSPYLPDEKTSTHNIEVVIIGIEVIEETIDIDDGEFQATFDMAVIFRSARKTFMLSRGWHYSEAIHISEDDNYEAVYPIAQDREAWSNDGEHKVSITRKRIQLS